MNHWEYSMTLVLRSNVCWLYKYMCIINNVYACIKKVVKYNY